jgi:hypothetical protein
MSDDGLISQSRTTRVHAITCQAKAPSDDGLMRKLRTCGICRTGAGLDRVLPSGFSRCGEVQYPVHYVFFAKQIEKKKFCAIQLFGRLL